MPRYGVILLNLGGPDSIDSIEPFLRNLFSDPDIFRFPLSSLTQKLFANLVSKFRSKKVRSYYEKIGGRSPILEITNSQAKKLKAEFTGENTDLNIYIGMRYWKPFIKDALTKALSEGVEKFILLPLYPQFSFTTTGSSLNEFKRLAEKFKINPDDVRVIRSYPDDELFVEAVVEKINESMNKFSKIELTDFAVLFSAHSIPLRFVEEGDPYPQEVEKTVKAVVKKLNFKGEFKIAYQSKVGPVKWLEPSVFDAIRDFAKRKIKNLLIVPISFVSDNLETLYELEIKTAIFSKSLGIEKFIVSRPVNDSPLFIKALKNLILKEIDER